MTAQTQQEQEERRERCEEGEETAAASASASSSDRKRRILEEEDEHVEDDRGEEEAELDDGGGEPMRTDDERGELRPATTPDEKRKPTPKSGEGEKEAQPFSPELLRVYYSRLFPFDMLADWLSYVPPSTDGGGGSGAAEANDANSGLLPRREFSFTLEPSPGDEIYVRYQSFSSSSELASAVRRRNPTKIDIGAVFTRNPRDKGGVPEGSFRPSQRELVFDVDLTDYDDVRRCGCSGAAICGRCWRLMGMAVRVVDAGLREDFGFEHVAWFYSGRRGVHAWVCDEAARMLTDEARSAVASYFEVSMGTDKNKRFSLPHPLHPMLSRSYDTLEPMFVKHILPESGHGLLASREAWDGLLATLPDGAAPVARRLERKWSAPDGGSSSPAEKWEELKRNLGILIGGRSSGAGGVVGKAAKRLSASDRVAVELWPARTVFRHCYPRLDVNVSKMRNHLLKSPFCVHPKTGRVCVPIDADAVEEFDPFDVPTLPRLMRELDEYERTHGAAAGGGDGVRHDWQKTSLREPFERFRRRFLEPLWKDLRRERRAASEERAAATGDF